MILNTVRDNLTHVMGRVEDACNRAGRNADDVTLVAVTKYAQVDWVRALVELGVVHLGESRPQQLVERVPQIEGPVRWHMIGHLQRNKVRPTLPVCGLIHSVDSVRLLDRIDRIAGELGLCPYVLLEVNVSGESTKGGLTGDELTSEWPQILSFENVAVDGLMTMAPLCESPEDTRPVFRGLRELRDRLREASPDRGVLHELSMGMSRDFEVAIEEGATIIRVGSRLYQGLGG